MTSTDTGSFRFDRFVLDPRDRQLRGADGPVELNGRYFDALTLMVREQGRLVSKDRFMDEVWRGIPVTDEALTQCVKTLRRQLGDDAARPRFIETVPKHGYRFIAPVEAIGGPASAVPLPAPGKPAAIASGSAAVRDLFMLGSAGTGGGALAGLVGGLIYGFASSTQPLAPGIGMGAASVLMVLVMLTVILASIGAAGVAFGIAAAAFASNRSSMWTIAGGAAGGLVVGAFVKLLGLDALTLLFGRAPGDITGAAEGLVLGGAVGLGAWLGQRWDHGASLRRSVAAAALAGGAAGDLIALLGGRLLGGSLSLLALGFPESRLRLDQIGDLLGERGFGPVTAFVTCGLEGMLFGGCVVGAMLIMSRRLTAAPDAGLAPPVARG